MAPLFVLVDGYSLLFRAFHSMGDMKASDGTPTGALFGLAAMLIKAIQDLQPDYLVVAFDYPAKTFRHEVYQDYKGHRDHAPEELKQQMVLSRELVKVLGIDYEELQGYEADDIIGTLAKQASGLGWQVNILSGDSDLAQVVNNHVTVIQTIKGVSESRILDPAAVRARYGIFEPRNLTDYKALVGDPSDNIPGVRGIGEVTAKKLLAQFHTIEEIYENLDKIDEKIRTKLELDRDRAFLSKNLATIHTDLPIKLNQKSAMEFQYDLSHIDKEAAAELFRKLGFKALADRIGLTIGKAEAAGVPIEWEIVDSDDRLKKLISSLLQKKRFALDYETTDLDASGCDMVGVAISTDSHLGYYIPVGHEPSLTHARAQLSVAKVMDALRPLLEDPGIEKVCQNAKYEWLVCKRYGIELQGVADDPMIADYLIDPDRRHGLKEMAQREIGWTMTPIEDLIGKKGKGQKCMSEIEVEKVAPYAAADATATWAIMEKHAGRLKEDGLDKLYRDVEIPLEPILARMQAVGIKLNTQVLKEMAEDLDHRMQDITKVIYQAIGHEINLNSPKQLGELLFDKLGLPRIKARSTDAEVLTKLGLQHEVPAMICEYRTLSKLRGTYTENLIELVAADGRIHTSYNQTIAATGRLSSSDPNLQNIPIRSELGQRIRRAFEPNNEGDVLLSADYSQIELRLLAHFSGDEKLIESFEHNEDIHRRTAMEVFGVGPDAVTPEMRRNAKVINFGIIYGMGPHGLAEQLGKSRSECKEFIDRFFQGFPSVRAYMDSSVKFGRENGYVLSLLGRRKYYPDLNSANHMKRSAAERAAINMPLQGSSADIIKMAMVQLQGKLEKTGLPNAILLQVHDELVLSVPAARQKELNELVGHTMAEIQTLKVPMVVNCKVGPNWLDMTSSGDFSHD
jgi:DNA polymerase-1